MAGLAWDEGICADLEFPADSFGQGRDRIQELAERVTAIQVEQRANVADKGADSNELNFGLTEVVYEWARGMVSGLCREEGGLTSPTEPACANR